MFGCSFPRRPRRAASLLLPVLILSAPAAGPAFAQQAGGPPADSKTADSKSWDIRLGAGALVKPDYEGSDDYEVAPLPLVDVTYRDIVFLKSMALGANVFTLRGPGPNDKLQFGPLLKYQAGRDQDSNDALRGLGDIDAGVELGAFVNYRAGPWSAGLTVFRDVSDAYDGGMTAQLKGGYMYPISQRLRLVTEVSTTWADDNYTEAFFGITALQAQRSGLRQYQAEGGFKDAGLSLALNYSLTDHWGVTGLVGYKRLLGDAADSPLVEDQGSANQLTGGLMLSYKF